MSFPTVILYDRSGCEIASRECSSMKEAKQAAKHYLSDLFAETSETTHEALGTMKVAIFSEADVQAGRTGADALCEWDCFYSAPSSPRIKRS